MSALDYSTSLSNREEISVSSLVCATAIDAAAPGLPTIIPRDQVYYWSARWQADIARAREQLTAGEYLEFDNGLDLVRWLLDEN